MTIDSISPLTPLKTDKSEYDYYNRFVNEYNSRFVMPFNQQLNFIKSKKVLPKQLKNKYEASLNSMKKSTINYKQSRIHEMINGLQKESKKYGIFSKKRKNINAQIKLFEKLKSDKESFISSPNSCNLSLFILIYIIILFVSFFFIVAHNLRFCINCVDSSQYSSQYSV